MSILLIRGRTGTGAAAEPTLEVPTLHARIAWRPIDTGLTALDWDGTSAAGWTVDGSGPSGTATSLTPTAADSFGGGSSLELVTAGTATSGADWAFTDTFVSGRTYRFRVGLRSVSGNTSATLRLGNASDYDTAAVTLTSTWAWATVDWTPSADRTDASASVQGDAITARMDHAEVYEALEDVTLESLRVTRGSRYDGGRDVPGTIDMTLLDPNDTYSPRNSASALYGSIEPGAPIHIRATYNGRLYAVAYGRVRSITPDAWAKKVTISADDGLDELKGYTIKRSFSLDQAAYEVRAAALASEALPTTQHDLATDSTEATPVVDGTDGTENLLSFLDDLNQVTGTTHYCAPHVEAIRPWKYKTVTRTTQTNDAAGVSIDEDFQRLDGPDIREEQFVTRQRVSWRGYEPLPSQVVAQATSKAPYWQFTDDRFGSSESPEDSTLFTIRRDRFKLLRSRDDRVQWDFVWRDFVGLELADGESREIVLDFKVPMEDISVDVTDTGGYVSTSIVPETSRVTITISASGGNDIITAISVTASPRLPIDEAEEQSDTAGASVVREGSEVRADRLQGGGDAGGLADYITWRYGAGRLRPSLVDQHHPVRQLTLDVGDHITLSADRWFVDADRYLIRSIEHDFSTGGKEHETTLGLEELPAAATDGDWVTIGGSSAQGIGSSAVLAY